MCDLGIQSASILPPPCPHLPHLCMWLSVTAKDAENVEMPNRLLNAWGWNLQMSPMHVFHWLEQVAEPPWV